VVSRLFKNVLPFMCSLINLIILKVIQKKFAIYMCPLKAHEIQCDPSFKSPRSKKPKFRSGALSFDFTIREAHKKGNKYPPPPKQRKSCSPWCMHDQSSMNGGGSRGFFILTCSGVLCLLTT
jgi:hypothetical protein